MADVTVTLSLTPLHGADSSWVPATQDFPSFFNPLTDWVYQDPISPPYLYSVSRAQIEVPDGATVTAVTFNYTINVSQSFTAVGDDVYVGRVPLIYVDFLQDTSAAFADAFSGLTSGELTIDISDAYTVGTYTDSITMDTALVRPGHSDVVRFGLDASSAPTTFSIPPPDDVQDEVVQCFGTASLVVTYHVPDDGGTSTHPRPGTPAHGHPTPGSGIPPALGGGVTVNHRTPPEMAANNLSGRNSPDIRISTNLRVAPAARIVSHG